MSHPIYSAQEARARETFLALMWALSYPAQIKSLPIATPSLTDTFEAIGDTLLDLETSFFTPDSALSKRLAHTGAPAVATERADYHFYPTLDDPTLAYLARANVGTALYPDASATLIIGCQLDSGTTLHLTGPGIQTTANLRIGGIPQAFWALRQKVTVYPLGWDIFFVDNTRVFGLPRTTNVMIEERA